MVQIYRAARFADVSPHRIAVCSKSVRRTDELTAWSLIPVVRNIQSSAAGSLVIGFVNISRRPDKPWIPVGQAGRYGGPPSSCCAWCIKHSLQPLARGLHPFGGL